MPGLASGSRLKPAASIRTSRLTRSGAVAATIAAVAPPMLFPTSAARSIPRRSMSPITARGKSSSDRSAGRSDSPKPGRSSATTSWRAARAGITSFQV